MKAREMNKLMIGMTLAALAAGCSTDKVHELMRAKPAPLTDFLPENERLVRRADTFLVHYTWLDTNAVVSAKFENVYVAPFDVSRLRKGKDYDGLKDKAMGGYDGMRDKLVHLDGAIDDLGQYGRETFVKAFKEHEKETKLKVVDDPKLPHTMVLEFAITAFVPTRAEVEAVGTVGSFFCPIPGVGLVADYLAAGSIAIECRARSSNTGKIVAMFADTEGEPSALLQFSKYTYTSGAKISLKKLAEECVLACKTKIEDQDKLRRSFPIEFIALPWENDLNEKVKGMLE